MPGIRFRKGIREMSENKNEIILSQKSFNTAIDGTPVKITKADIITVDVYKRRTRIIVQKENCRRAIFVKEPIETVNGLLK